MQRAVTPLAAQGLLDRCRGRGTFVQAAASKPLVAIVLGPALTNESAHYYRAALEALREETRGRGWASRVYDGLNPATEAGQPQKDDLHGRRPACPGRA